jgi:hypothetical protein
VIELLAFEAARAVAKTKKKSSGPDLKGTAALVAYTGIIVVPVLVALNPSWLRRWTIPMLAVTAMGIYATVPDTENVRTVMFVMVPAGALCALLRVKVPWFVASAASVVILWQAIQDAAGQAPPIIRAIGCFAALLAMPVAGWLAQLLDRGRPAILAVLITHGAFAVFASRALVHQRSIAVVGGGIAAALLAAVGVLFLAARPVEPEP